MIAEDVLLSWRTSLDVVDITQVMHIVPGVMFLVQVAQHYFGKQT